MTFDRDAEAIDLGKTVVSDFKKLTAFLDAIERRSGEIIDLIVREAGGLVTDAGDGPFVLDAPGIVATNGFLHRAIIDVLRMSGQAGGSDVR